MKQLLLTLIKFYRKFISPMTPLRVASIQHVLNMD